VRHHDERVSLCGDFAAALAAVADASELRAQALEWMFLPV